MSKWEKLFERIMSGDADANIRFDETCALLQRLKWSVRIRGSHHWFTKSGMPPINLQPRQGYVKPYQVKQIREALEIDPDVRTN